MYCRYCGRIAHRCQCMQQDSLLRQLLLRRQPVTEAQPLWQTAPYKRGVPPQIKKRERAALRSQYQSMMAAVIERDGPACANCYSEAPCVLDHILPVAKGGRSELDNLQLLCPLCNRLKGKLWLDCRVNIQR